MRIKAAFAAAALLACQAVAWIVAERPTIAPDVPRFQSVSLTPYEPNLDISSGGRTTAERIRADMKAVSGITNTVRTYSSTNGMELVPSIAAEYGIKVRLGIWLDKDEARNEREILAGIEAAKSPAVTSIIVGNEVLLRDDMPTARLIAIMKRVRAATGKPVTTGDVSGVWIDHPELAAAADYIAAHMLPYWEGVTASRAVDWTISTERNLAATYPGKKVLIAEFGWPSAGQNRGAVFAGAVSQARILREFAHRADALGISYNVMEGIDQPWKVLEGSVGPNWGVLDADRNLKFPLEGPIETPLWQARAAGGIAIAFLLSLPVLLIRRPRLLEAALAAAAANVIGAWLSSAAVEAFVMGYVELPGRLMAIAGIVLLLVLAVTSLSRISEILSCLGGRKPGRLLVPAAARERRKVSIHIPACREPGPMLVETLNSIAALEDADIECIVVVNNTPDGADKEMVRDHCGLLGERFIFLDVGTISGFKAGALNIALSRTSRDADVIAVIDADYTVNPRWLAETLHAFDDPKIGIVQAPQDHRDGNRSRLHGWMNAEYAGFFDVGMVERNEIDAIVAHGTMIQIRRSALEAVGGWPTDTICEDTDLGLALTEAGWGTIYTSTRYGHGLLPDGYHSFRKQRHRWAFGGVQIASKRMRSLFSRANRMSLRQRAAFGIGWVSWMGSEAIGALLALMNILWAFYVVTGPGAAIPSLLLTAPLAVAVGIQVTHFHLTYAARVNSSVSQRIGASILAMSLQSTVARAVAEALILRHMPFIRTAKGGSASGTPLPYLDLVMAAGLLSAACLLFANNYDNVVELHAFTLVIVLQSVPFLAASAFGISERRGGSIDWRSRLRGIWRRPSGTLSALPATP